MGGENLPLPRRVGGTRRPKTQFPRPSEAYAFCRGAAAPSKEAGRAPRTPTRDRVGLPRSQLQGGEEKAQQQAAPPARPPPLAHSPKPRASSAHGHGAARPAPAPAPTRAAISSCAAAAAAAVEGRPAWARRAPTSTAAGPLRGTSTPRVPLQAHAAPPRRHWLPRVPGPGHWPRPPVHLASAEAPPSGPTQVPSPQAEGLARVPVPALQAACVAGSPHRLTHARDLRGPRARSSRSLLSALPGVSQLQPKGKSGPPMPPEKCKS